MIITKAFKAVNEKGFFKGRVEQLPVRVELLEIDNVVAEVAQYKVEIKDSRRLLFFVTVVTVMNNEPGPQTQFEMPVWSGIPEIQWRAAVSKVHDIVTS